MFGIVYLITNLLDGKKYVGQTTRTLEERFSEHAEADFLLGKAIKACGGSRSQKIESFHAVIDKKKKQLL